MVDKVLVVVEVPKTLAKTDREGVTYIRERLERIDRIDAALAPRAYEHNWMDRVKSFRRHLQGMNDKPAALSILADLQADLDRLRKEIVDHG